MSTETPPTVDTQGAASRPASGGEIAGFVVSIIALLTSVIGGGFLLGIIALVIIGVSRRRTAGRSSLGRAAVIIGIIAIVLGALFAIRAGIAAMGA